uniref:Uncharacterized protein n=1 Tax=Timema tahoe TaxID=61484 RepID=A0A7R9IQQ6_9NEOP|nr:unnamed protein product [Timema tahoe]
MSKEWLWAWDDSWKYVFVIQQSFDGWLFLLNIAGLAHAQNARATKCNFTTVIYKLIRTSNVLTAREVQNLETIVSLQLRLEVNIISFSPDSNMLMTDIQELLKSPWE